MSAFALATDHDRERAREDPAFRQKLLSDHLDRLLDELNRLRRGKPDAERAKQIREGVDLAVKLADLLQK